MLLLSLMLLFELSYSSRPLLLLPLRISLNLPMRPRLLEDGDVEVTPDIAMMFGVSLPVCYNMTPPPTPPLSYTGLLKRCSQGVMVFQSESFKIMWRIYYRHAHMNMHTRYAYRNLQLETVLKRPRHFRTCRLPILYRTVLTGTTVPCTIQNER